MSNLWFYDPRLPQSYELFDVGNIIVRSTHAITYAILADYGVRMDVAPSFFHHPDYANFGRGVLTSWDFAGLIRKRFGIDLTDEQIYRAHNAHLYDVDEGVLEVVRLLPEDLDLGLATDTNEWQSERVQELVPNFSLMNLAVQRFESHVLDMLKSDPGFFETVGGNVGCTAQECLLIDDSPEKVAHAAMLGMHTHRFTSAAALREELVRLGLLT